MSFVFALERESNILLQPGGRGGGEEFSGDGGDHGEDKGRGSMSGENEI